VRARTTRSHVTVLALTLGAGLARGSVARAAAREEFDASGRALTRAEEPHNEAAACGEPIASRPPDPLCGETLDGRAAPSESAWWTVPRAALWVPRALSDVLLWPVVAVTDPIEHHHVFDHLEALLTSDDKTIGLRPELRYATGFLPVLGLRFFDHRLAPPVFAFDAHALTAGPAVVIGETELRGPAWSGLTLSALYHRRNDMLFAGIGPNSAEDLRAQGVTVARYVSKVWAAALDWVRPLGPWLFLNLHGDVQDRSYSSDSVRGGPSVANVFSAAPQQCATFGAVAPCVNPTAMPGFYSGVTVGQVGGGLRWDTRRRTRDGGGFSLAGDATYSRGIDGDPGHWLTYWGETVLAFGGRDRVFLLRGWASTVQSLANAPVPFEELVVAAGMLGMRGFPEGRFRGQSGVVGSAEYRYYILAALDASVFADLGTVAGPWFEDIRWNRWFPDFGLGLRFVPWSGPHWETIPSTGVQFVYAPDNGFRLIFSLAAF
jgi:hypothetical protein